MIYVVTIQIDVPDDSEFDPDSYGTRHMIEQAIKACTSDDIHVHVSEVDTVTFSYSQSIKDKD